MKNNPANLVGIIVVCLILVFASKNREEIKREPVKTDRRELELLPPASSDDRFLAYYFASVQGFEGVAIAEAALMEPVHIMGSGLFDPGKFKWLKPNECIEPAPPFMKVCRVAAR